MAGERFRLDGRNAIVTGGSTGIGREVVKGLVDLGARVVFNSTENSKDAAESLVDETEGKAIWVPGYVQEKATTDSLIKTTRDHLGNPHIVVAAAGITRDGAFLRQSDEDFEAVYDVKVNSARRLTQAALRFMSRENWGRFLYIGSVSADGSPWQVNYAMANAALEGLAKSVAAGYADKGIAANVLKPALVDSKLTRPPALAEEPRQKIIDQMPIGRVLEPVEIADTVLMLVAQRTPVITGSTLYADGGMRRI